MTRRNRGIGPILLGAWVALQVGAAQAGIHTWDVNEVFSNADGTIQFVELWEANGTPGETGVGNGTITSNTQSHSFGNGAVTAPTTNKHYLIATPDFAALPGAPTPDEILPVGKVPFFNKAGDTVAFGGFDSFAFGAVPTNGTDSLHKLTGVGVNTPTNYAGVSGTVNAAGPPSVPVAPQSAMLIMVALLMTGGIASLLWYRRSLG